MNLYVFEPYEWDYCGGAIGILANSYKEAIDVIIKEDKKNAKNRLKSGCYNNLTADDLRSYRRKYFLRTKDGSKGSRYDQWLLTVELEVVDNGSPRVLFDNWNYA